MASQSSSSSSSAHRFAAVGPSTDARPEARLWSSSMCSGVIHCELLAPAASASVRRRCSRGWSAVCLSGMCAGWCSSSANEDAKLRACRVRGSNLGCAACMARSGNEAIDAASRKCARRSPSSARRLMYAMALRNYGLSCAIGGPSTAEGFANLHSLCWSVVQSRTRAPTFPRDGLVSPAATGVNPPMNE